VKDVTRQDHWRRIEAKAGSSHAIDTIATKGGMGFGAFSYSISSPLQLIVGPNAYGKTRILTQLEAAVRGDESVFTVQEALPGLVTAYVDVSWQIRRQMASIEADDALSERREQAPESSFVGRNLQDLSWALNQGLRRVAVYELDATDDLDTADQNTSEHAASRASRRFRPEAVPYFEVVYEDGRTVTSLDLSQGELALLTLFWALTTSDPGSVLFLDEPDTFLSPLAGSRALDIIARMTHEKSLQCFMTTHGYLSIAQVPTAHVAVATRRTLDSGITLEPANADSLWRVLRIQPPLRFFLAVEDEAGIQLLRLLLRLQGVESSETIHIAKTGGSAGVRAVAQFPLHLHPQTEIFGVLDGDERDPNKGKPYKAIFLPSGDSPEELALAYLRISPDSASESIDGALVSETLARVQGDNVHDQLSAVAEAVGAPLTTLREVTWTSWLLNTPEGAAALGDFGTSLVTIGLKRSDAG
jgi:ABC-type branched-subunit amino acid transport system ATPase component